MPDLVPLSAPPKPPHKIAGGARKVPIPLPAGAQEVRQYTTVSPPPPVSLPKPPYEQTPAPSSSVVSAPATISISSLPKMRTYRSDVNSVVTERGISAADIALAEQRRRYGQLKNVSTERPDSYVGTIILIVLLFAIGGAAFFVGYKTLQPSPAVVMPGVARTSLIVSETDEEIEITSRSAADIREQIRARLTGADITLASVREYFFTTTRTLTDGPVKLYISTPLFFGAINSSIPSDLLRNLVDTFMYGVFSFDGNRGFLIVQPTSLSIAFASMLEWEDNGLIRDLAPLLTPKQITQDDIFAPFQDGVISNQDVRIAYDPQGNEVLMYSLTSQNLLVVATDRVTFGEVMARLNTPAPVSR
ncbi:MAG: hypothetical protein Q8P93_04470 [bacterium]|nr:hypothetical protein [bacterium]